MEKGALLQKVLALKQNGYTNKQIIAGLSNEGISMTDIQEAIIQAELKRIIEEQNKPLQQPLPPTLPDLQNIPPPSFPQTQPLMPTPVESKKVQQSPYSLPVSSSQNFEVPVSKNIPVNVIPSLPHPQTNLPPPYLDSEMKIESSQNITTSNILQEIADGIAKAKGEIIAEIKLELERIVEIIVAEKLKQYETFADEINESQKETSAKIKAIEVTTKHINSAIERNDIELTEQTKTLNEHIQKLTAELVAMSNIVEKILPVFVDNVKKLTAITDKISRNTDNITIKGKKQPEKEKKEES